MIKVSIEEKSFLNFTADYVDEHLGCLLRRKELHGDFFDADGFNIFINVLDRFPRQCNSEVIDTINSSDVGIVSVINNLPNLALLPEVLT
jgi:hypothetical protein